MIEAELQAFFTNGWNLFTVFSAILIGILEPRYFFFLLLTFVIILTLGMNGII